MQKEDEPKPFNLIPKCRYIFTLKLEEGKAKIFNSILKWQPY